MSRKKQPNTDYELVDACEVEGCEAAAVVCGMCSPCYQYEWRWSRASPAKRRLRKKKVELFNNRLDRIAPPKLRSVR